VGPYFFLASGVLPWGVAEIGTTHGPWVVSPEREGSGSLKRWGEHLLLRGKILPQLPFERKGKRPTDLERANLCRGQGGAKKRKKKKKKDSRSSKAHSDYFPHRTTPRYMRGNLNPERSKVRMGGLWHTLERGSVAGRYPVNLDARVNNVDEAKTITDMDPQAKTTGGGKKKTLPTGQRSDRVHG